ncbi:HK97 family phage prohead protease [Bradyrhizobium sp. I1.7.5]|jgi:phage head maturation protease|uniref:HK97 family phage prohead protease n=1 Tax=Bradyrhizobium sp. I1.7.5 TaxID=3156363 RepID=UPI003395AA1C
MLPRSDQLFYRLADSKSAGAPRSYDRKAHTVDAVISMGTAVKRAYGVEVLRISPHSVDLSRLYDGGIPLLDHHRQDGLDSVLGRVTEAWIERGALVGRIKFNQTEQGQKAEGMVARGELTGISAGYRVEEWEITDADGDLVNERDICWDDGLTFTATRWQLFEASLVGVPADAVACVRSIGSSNELVDIRARMLARQRMFDRMGQLDD